MLKNYLKIAFRNIKRNKAYTFINIFGLAVGYAIFILAVLFAELNFDGDAFHENAERMYGIVQVLDDGNKGETLSAVIPPPVSAAVMEEFPEIEEAVSFFRPGRKVFKRDNENFYESSILYAESNFLNFFTFNMITGNPNSVLSEPNSVVLTEETAEKYFGDEDPVGKTLIIDQDISLTVTGVIEETPDFSGLRFDFLISMETEKLRNPEMFKNWKSSRLATFVRLPEGFNYTNVNDKFPEFITSRFDDSASSPKRMYLFPMLDFYFSGFDINSPWAAEPVLPYVIFVVMGVILLLVVCVNFMNLSTARYTVRAKEIGLRKVVGARRIQLVRQFLGESMLLSLLALPLGIALFEIIRPLFITFYNNYFTFSLWEHPGFIVRLLIIVVVTGILAGLYPALFLSGFKPAQVLKSDLQKGRKGGRFRKILVASQFVLSVVLIIFTIVVNKQFDYLIELDFGFNRENVFYVPVENVEKPDIELLRSGIKNFSGVVDVSTASVVPGSIAGYERDVVPEGYSENEKIRLDVTPVNYDFVELYDMKLTRGRSFSKEYNDEFNLILSEATVASLEWQDPLGKEMTVDGRKGIVIGVVESFTFRQPYFKKVDAALSLEPDRSSYLFVKTGSTGQLNGVVDLSREEWQKVISDVPFVYGVHEENFRRWHQGTKKGSEICGAIGLVTIIISCMGLFGLASFTVQRKTKEIGVRKVLGASVSGIIQMLGKEFLLLVLISNVVAWPLAYYGSKSFINNMYFSYSIDIGIWIYVFAAVASVLSGVLAVTTQTYKAARANPVDALKYE